MKTRKYATPAVKGLTHPHVLVFFCMRENSANTKHLDNVGLPLYKGYTNVLGLLVTLSKCHLSHGQAYLPKNLFVQSIHIDPLLNQILVLVCVA